MPQGLEFCSHVKSLGLFQINGPDFREKKEQSNLSINNIQDVMLGPGSAGGVEVPDLVFLG